MDIANILANASESIEFVKKSSILKFEIHGVKKSLHDFYEPCSEGKAELFGVYAIVKTSSKYNETVWIADFNSRKEAETSLVFLSVYFCSKEKRENMKKALPPSHQDTKIHQDDRRKCRANRNLSSLSLVPAW